MPRGVDKLPPGARSDRTRVPLGKAGKPGEMIDTITLAVGGKVPLDLREDIQVLPVSGGRFLREDIQVTS